MILLFLFQTLILYVLQLVDTFHQLSGLKLYIDKTVAKCTGSLEHYECHNRYSISWTDAPLCTLAITISNDPEVILYEIVLPRQYSIAEV